MTGLSMGLLLRAYKHACQRREWWHVDWANGLDEAKSQAQYLKHERQANKFYAALVEKIECTEQRLESAHALIAYWYDLAMAHSLQVADLFDVVDSIHNIAGSV